MHVHRGFEIKEKRYATPGELVTVDIAGMSTFAIVLKPDLDGSHYFLGLSSKHDIKHPFWYHDRQSDGFLISYGTDWIFDIGVADDEELGEFGSNSDLGSILFSESQIYMRVGGSDQRYNLQNRSVDLSTFTFGTPALTENTICIKSWRIWRTKERMNNPAASPMITYEVP